MRSAPRRRVTQPERLSDSTACGICSSPSGRLPELLNGGLESTQVALVVLVSWRKPHHLTFEPLKVLNGSNGKADGPTCALHFDNRLAMT